MAKTAKQPLILLGLNEVNFEYIQHYIARGYLPNFKKLFEQSALIKTSSEEAYEELEPWIQWVSIQTGKTFSEHGIFRLGDVVEDGNTQIWEHLEDKYGITVAALSPFNAANRAKNPAFFVPDPWTKTTVTGGWLMKKVAEAVADAVNENATGGSKLSSYIYLILAVLRYSLLKRHVHIVLLILKALKSHYHRAILLDQILTDVFCSAWKSSKPEFSSLFLNSVAHLQHHYMFNSTAYEGRNKNPDWYMPSNKDPLLEGLKSYDTQIAQVLKLPNNPRVFIATGLHQNPVETPVFYWRLKDHASFLTQISAKYKKVTARMSRDFLIECNDKQDAAQTAAKLAACADDKGIALFKEIDNRGASLFVTLTYPHDFKEGMSINHEKGKIDNFRDHVGFVALKNGEHDGEGYFVDSANKTAQTDLPITEIFGLMDQHFADGFNLGKVALYP